MQSCELCSRTQLNAAVSTAVCLFEALIQPTLSSVVVTDELEEGEDLLVIPESDTSTCPQIVAPASKLRPERSTVRNGLQVAPPISRCPALSHCPRDSLEACGVCCLHTVGPNLLLVPRSDSSFSLSSPQRESAGCPDDGCALLCLWIDSICVADRPQCGI